MIKCVRLVREWEVDEDDGDDSCNMSHSLEG